MGAGWTTGGVRARALLQRRLGVSGARQLAAGSSLADAVTVLRQGPYRRGVPADHQLEQVEHGVAATLLWHLRVLAGWQPRAGAEAVRLLAGWFEIANTVEHARALAGQPAGQPYRLGTLATAWPQLSAATSLVGLRAALAASPWNDPGEPTPAAIAIGMQAAWAQRVDTALPVAASWAAGGAALLAARERFLAGRDLTAPVARRLSSVLGTQAVRTGSWAAFVPASRAAARWALTGLTGPAELWRAETRWWTRVQQDGFRLLRRPRFGMDSLIGCVALLAVDAWRVRAALQIAARGGRELEAFDALA